MTEKIWESVPEGVAFNITEECNLKCQYCFQSTNKSRSTLSYKEIIRVLRYLNRIGVKEVLIEGGEVFMLPFIGDLLLRLKSYNFRCYVISNGTLISSRLASLVAKSNISIGISIDGPNEESNSFRGSNTFRKAMKGIAELTKSGTTTYINCTITKQNADFLPGLIELCNEMKMAGIVLQQLHCSGKEDAERYRKDFITYRQLKELNKTIPLLRQENKKLDFVESEILCLISAPDRYSKVCNPLLEYMPKKIFRCGAGRRFCLIRADLDIVPCGILDTYTCGNMSDKSLIEVWRGSPELAFIRELSEKRVDTIRGCDTCSYNPICDGGCRADMYNYSGDWLAPHIFCPYNKEIEYR